MARLPFLDRSIQIVTEKFTPSLAFHQWWQSVIKAIEAALTGLETSVAAIQAALDAADAANAAAATAQSAATDAQTAADSAQAVADGSVGLTSVVNSGLSTNPLTANDVGSSASISIATHDRLYPDGTTVTVNGGVITLRAYSTQYWVYYDDPTRAGGAVTYASTTTESVAAQAGDRHLVGTVTTPAALGADTNGQYKIYPGLGGLQP